MLIFFDTEFTGLHFEARLISIGFVSEDGRTFYAELSDTYTPENCSWFTLKTVLPLLDGGEARMPMHALTLCLGNWLEDFGEPVKLATDSCDWDWPWIQRIFHTPGTWPANLDGKPVLLTMNYLMDYDAFTQAMEHAFSGGLRRHHALDDAKANRLGWIAAGGDIDHAPSTAPLDVLHGSVLRYDNPTDPLADSDWDAAAEKDASP